MNILRLLSSIVIVLLIHVGLVINNQPTGNLAMELVPADFAIDLRLIPLLIAMTIVIYALLWLRERMMRC